MRDTWESGMLAEFVSSSVAGFMARLANGPHVYGIERLCWIPRVLKTFGWVSPAETIQRLHRL